jgi:EAL domain-containing protein (putative c-di-GMP-specific phosphodiesterase class I)
MGLRIVAEGIEDRGTLQLISDLGCDLAQGYCISKPKPAGELAFRYEIGTKSGRPNSHLEDLPASA